jgi:hypothetical protein
VFDTRPVESVIYTDNGYEMSINPINSYVPFVAPSYPVIVSMVVPTLVVIAIVEISPFSIHFGYNLRSAKGHKKLIAIR